MKKFFYFFGLLAMIGVSPVSSQDIHLSQFDGNPLFYNPASTGFIQGDLRVASSFRNQWSTISRGYNTFLFSLDGLLFVNPLSRSGFGLGFSVQRDVAGQLSYGQTNWAISTSYVKSLRQANDHWVSIGLQVGKGARMFDPSRAIFGNDKWADIPETFLIEKNSFFDISGGFLWEYKASKRQTLNLGFSVFHLNQPNLAFLDQNVFLHRRWNMSMSFLHRVGKYNAIRPTISFQQQHKYRELIYGADWKWYVNESPLSFLSFSTGVYYRHGDAVILMLKADYLDWTAGLSYDFNASGLTKVSKTYGAMEVTLIYIVRAMEKKLTQRKIPCPSF